MSAEHAEVVGEMLRFLDMKVETYDRRAKKARYESETGLYMGVDADGWEHRAAACWAALDELQLQLELSGLAGEYE